MSAQISATPLDAEAIRLVAKLIDKNFKFPEVVVDEKAILPIMTSDVEVKGHIEIIKELIKMVKKPSGIPKIAENVTKMWDWIGYGIELSSLIRLNNFELLYPKLLPLKSSLDNSMYLADNNISLCDVFIFPYVRTILSEYAKKYAATSSHTYSFALRYNNLLCHVIGGYEPLAIPPTSIPEFVAAKDARRTKSKKPGKGANQPNDNTK